MFVELLKELKEKQIDISFINGKLNFAGPKDNIDDNLLKRLKENRGKLIKHFWPLKDSNLIPIQTEGNNVPFIMVHGEQANYFLSEKLGEEMPFYGFAHLGDDGKVLPFKKLNEYVEDYCNQILKVIGNKTIILGGYSFGGIIAFEIACKLQKMGYTIQCLILIDISPIPFYKSSLKQKMGAILYQLLKHILWRTLPKVGISIPKRLRRKRMFNEYVFLYQRYRINNYFSGKSLIFKASNNIDGAESIQQWSKYISEIEIIELKGSHFSIFYNENGINQLKESVMNYLNEENNKK